MFLKSRFPDEEVKVFRVDEKTLKEIKSRASRMCVPVSSILRRYYNDYKKYEVSP